MSNNEKQKRVCPNGHSYYKSSDCPVCPICENKRQPHNEFLNALSAPARRALENAGITTLAKLSKKTEKEILSLHGMGPGSIPVLKKALKEKGLKLKAKS
jgi:DNA-directed RNA polymerase alpha subunit